MIPLLVLDAAIADLIKALFLVALVDSLSRPHVDDPTKLPRAIQRWWRRPR